jgi:hypothetical protein
MPISRMCKIPALALSDSGRWLAISLPLFAEVPVARSVGGQCTVPGLQQGAWRLRVAYTGQEEPMKALLFSLLLSSLFASPAFTQTSATFAEPPALPQLLWYILILIAFYFLLIRPRLKKRRPLLTAGGYRGRNMKAQQNEATRLALASAVIQGSAYRRRILKKFKTRYRAYAPEIGIDVPRLLSICSNMERREVTYEIIFVALLIIALFSMMMIAFYGILFVSLGLTVPVALYKFYNEHFLIGQIFSASRFSKEPPEKVFPLVDAPNQGEVAFDFMNVCVYKGFSPFYFAGQIVGRVSFIVDVTRGAENRPARPFVVSELYDVVSAALLEAHRDVFYLKDVLLISGQDVPACQRYCMVGHFIGSMKSRWRIGWMRVTAERATTNGWQWWTGVATSLCLTLFDL